MPKGENVGPGVMVLALMLNMVNMVNVGHGVMELVVLQKGSIWLSSMAKLYFQSHVLSN